MLRAWLACPLDMWLRHVLRVPEDEPTGDRVPPNVVGEAVHGVLQALYTPWLGRSLQAAELRSAAGEVRGLLSAAMAAEVPAHRLVRGEPLLQLGMAGTALEAFLRAEATLVERGMDIRPMHLELEVRQPLGLPLAHAAIDVNIVGRLDRVDLRDGRWHVLDLKTGRVDAQQLRLKALHVDHLRRDKGHAAQLLLYAWAFLGMRPDAREVSCGLLPLQRTGTSEPALLNIDGEAAVTAPMRAAIADVVRAVVDRMLEPGFVYRHDERSLYCALCAG
jgi:RecB family exonuclease